jgi:predicted nucleic acid-binding protein
MENRGTLIDTGPLYALLDRRDQNHQWACSILPSLRPPFLTCDAVLSEAFFLLAENPGPTRQLREYLEKGIIVSSFKSHPFILHILDLMEKYSNVPMAFADACLVCMIEQGQGDAIFTTDEDFRVYRQHKRRLIPLMAPF